MIGSFMEVIGIVISIVICFSLFVLLRKKVNHSKLKTCFNWIIINLLICLFGLLLQSTLGGVLNIPLVYYDYFVYIGSCFLPVSVLFMSLTFANPTIKFGKKYLLFFIIPILSLIILWTNDLHHLFYITYSINLYDVVYGAYFVVYSIHSYILLFLGLLILLIYSIRNSGFFSKQSLLILLGTSIPILINLLGYIRVIKLNVYSTPISFTLGVSFYVLSIFKFKFLSISPIALRNVVDRMSDGYIVINEENKIVEFNKTFSNLSSLKEEQIIGTDVFDLVFNKLKLSIDREHLAKTLLSVKEKNNTATMELNLQSKLYLSVEISAIYSKENFLGILLLFKDITQHVRDLRIIEENQNMLVEKERLASLGQMIGGIAHNLKTPIMSIAGAAEGLADLIKEIDLSVGNPSVTVEDYHEITKEMDSWIEKIRTHTSYMSDVITSVKGQAVNFSENQIETFKIEELIKRISILMKHELQNSLTTLNINDSSDPNLSILGNINSLVQVVNNMISNSIQAYNGKENAVIDLIITSSKEKITISVKDYGCGMSEEVKNKLFTQMITTKGKNGTGLGLFMSYSNIKAHFNGDITFTSELNKGTEFNIILPVSKI